MFKLKSIDGKYIYATDMKLIQTTPPYLVYYDEKDTVEEIYPWQLDLNDIGTIRNMISMIGMEDADSAYSDFKAYWGD